MPSPGFRIFSRLRDTVRTSLLFAAAFSLGMLFPACIAATPVVSGGKSYDLVVVEATPAGIAMSVRAAREGLDVLLVNHNGHLGGILSSGLGVWDTLYEGRRSPIYDEAREAIFRYYRDTYGKNSHEYLDSLPGKSGHSNGKFEPRVAEKILTDLVTKEPRITVLKGFVPSKVEREGSLLRTVTFRELDGDNSLVVTGRIFADCTYEGDLAALAKVPYRVGREAQSEYNEPHAGQIFMRSLKAAKNDLAQKTAEEHATLNLRKFDGLQEINEAASTGAADRNVQAFNFRTILTSDPARRLTVEKPTDYDPKFLKSLTFTSLVASIPGEKTGWNRPQLIGPHQAYVVGDWATRRKVMDAHWNAMLGLLYYLQNDPSVPESVRKTWSKFGIAKDEFVDNGNRPYEIYVREARRIAGRATFTEHDATLAPGLKRAPANADSIAVTEWYLDTHACTPARAGGSLEEGKMMLETETFPGEVSYLTILPEGLDNLLVPVCLSATHVAWGTIRLEPTWMNIAESAAFASAQAIKSGQTPAQIDIDELLRTLARQRVMISFFNDVDLGGTEQWIPAVQYFGTKGFFADYNARATSPLTPGVAKIWTDAFAKMRDPKYDPNAVAREVAKVAGAKEPSLGVSEFVALLPAGANDAAQKLNITPTASITRGDACRLLFDSLNND